MNGILTPFGGGAGAGERLVLGGVTILLRAWGAATGGAFTLLEEVAPLADTPLHVHEKEDELFYALEGEHIFRIGDEEFRVGPGGFAFGPRGVPHSQRRVTPGVGRLLIVSTPSGIEGFFQELAAAHADGTLGAEAYARASERYGITWLG